MLLMAWLFNCQPYDPMPHQADKTTAVNNDSSREITRIVPTNSQFK